MRNSCKAIVECGSTTPDVGSKAQSLPLKLPPFQYSNLQVSTSPPSPVVPSSHAVKDCYLGTTVLRDYGTVFLQNFRTQVAAL